jgi:hypothetical protein
MTGNPKFRKTILGLFRLKRKINGSYLQWRNQVFFAPGANNHNGCPKRNYKL